MNSISESISYWAVKSFGAIVRVLPVHFALALGRVIGSAAFYLDQRHRRIVYSNLKIAFSATKSPQEIRTIARETFEHFGQNIIELFRLPLMTKEAFQKYVQVEGLEHAQKALRDNKGLIFLAMHFGSWEMANLIGMLLDRPYKVLVKPQERFSRLDDLLNSYRRGSGSVVLERGMGTRDFIKSLKDNEAVGLVVDQGGKDGVLVPFFGREASMSAGALRLGVKLGVPVCFAVIVRKKNSPYHQIIIHKPLEMTNTGNVDEDVVQNLRALTPQMQEYISRYPAEYMWFYKIWKYSRESSGLILSDDKAGHLRQSQAVLGQLQNALAERQVTLRDSVLSVTFRGRFWARVFALVSCLSPWLGHGGRIALLKWCLSPQTYQDAISIKPDFIISCGSSVAGLNRVLSCEHNSKSIVVLKPGIQSVNSFDLVFLPRHDAGRHRWPSRVAVTQGAPNLINGPYLAQQKALLLKRFSHLAQGSNLRVGVLLGGDTRDFVLSEQRVRYLLHQLIEFADEVSADILLTTSRRTSPKVENLLARELKKRPRCKLLVLANRENVSEAVGGILALADFVVVSADSISMVSEAASAGKKLIAFAVEHREAEAFERTKHGQFLDQMHQGGFVLSADVMAVKEALYQLMKNKVQTRRLDDGQTILEQLRRVI